MAVPEEELDELVNLISTAIEKARQLHLNTSAYILSMVLVEVTEAAKARPNGSPDDPKP